MPCEREGPQPPQTDDGTALHAGSSAALSALLAQAAALTEAAVQHSSCHRFGPLSLRVDSNDREAARRLTRCLLPAAAAVPADLQIFVLCGSSPPFALPPRWNLPHSDARHLERLHLAPDGSITAFHDDDRRFWMMLDRPARRALFWIAAAEQIPFWEPAAPFKFLLHWFLASHPMAMVHGGVVSVDGQGALLVGPGGSGKSTTVASCLAAGLQVCGDDLVIVERAAPGWQAHALYDSIKLSANGGLPVPARLDAAPWQACGDKRLVRYSDVRAESLAPCTRLTALLQCVVSGEQDSKVVPVSPSVLLRAIAPPTVFLLRGHETSTLAKIGALVRELPCYRIELGTDPAGVVALLESLLSGRKG